MLVNFPHIYVTIILQALKLITGGRLMTENKTTNSEHNDVLFTIKELDVIKSEDGNLNLKIKIPEEFITLFFKNNNCKNIFINKHNFKLTDREKEVLEKISQGKNNNEIASELFVSIHTVKAHVASILQKLSVEDRVQAAVKAISENIVEK